MAHLAVREVLLLGILGLAAALFINHGVLYLTGDATPRSARPEAYLLTTAIFYVFVRGAYLVLSLRPPRIEADLVLCPECGQELGDPTPRGVSNHLRLPVVTKPTERDVLAAVALRKAIDEAREVAKARGREVDPVVSALRGDFENAPARLLRDLAREADPPEPPAVPKEPWRPRLGR